MEYINFRDKVWTSLEKYKINSLGITEKYCKKYKRRNSDEYFSVKYGHILPKDKTDKNLMDGVAFPDGADIHKDAHHLNSSQIMCINFFAHLIETESGKKILLEWIGQRLGISLCNGVEIAEASFEKVFFENEGTNFDFYIKLSDGKNIYFEIKYTENGFGKANGKSDSYTAKWRDVYAPMIAESLYLKDIDKDSFLKNYQINRNVAYIKNENDFCVFLYPFENGSLEEEMKNICYKNIRKVDWDDAVQTVLELTEGSGLFGYYEEFRKKYLSFL